MKNEKNYTSDNMRSILVIICTFFLFANSLALAQDTVSKSPEKLSHYLASNPEYIKTQKVMKRFRASKSPVVGIATHRGANEFAPENTLSAMKIALFLDVDYIEIDVRQTKDSKSVILHDGNLDRTTNGKGPLRNLNLEEVRTLSAGSWFNPVFSSEKIPTLEEACRLVADHNNKAKHKTWFYVDCKDIDVKILIENLSKYGLLNESVFYVNEQQIRQIRELAPMARMLPGLGSPKEFDHLVETFHPFALDVNWKDATKELIEKAHARGVKIFSDGFGEDQNVDSYLRAISAGIDVISTNKVSVICEAAAKIK